MPNIINILPPLPSAFSLICLVLSLILAPLLQGIINRVKAKFAGRRGKPLLQLYFDLWKLLHKGAVYPRCSSWVFQAGPALALVNIFFALCFIPLGQQTALFSFNGDFILMTYLLAMGRFATMLAALDTGSAFEGMGSSREATFGAMAEPVLLLTLLALGFKVGSYSLSAMLGHTTLSVWLDYWPVLCLIALAIFILLLLENCRIPADDPTTHLELTMIHEVMVLDHGGPDLAFVEYAAALKLWLFCSIFSDVLLPDFSPAMTALNPFSFSPTAAQLAGDLAGMILTLLMIFSSAAVVGVIESCMARLRMESMPQLPAIAGVLTALAFLLLWR